MQTVGMAVEATSADCKIRVKIRAASYGHYVAFQIADVVIATSKVKLC